MIGYSGNPAELLRLRTILNDGLSGETDQACAEAAAELERLAAVLDEAYQIVRDGVDGHRTPWGACYAAQRVMEDLAPAEYRQPLEHYRHGGKLDG